MTDRQRAILDWLTDRSSETPADIAWGIGMNDLPPVVGGRGQGGRGKGHRVFNPAQRIISSLTGLRKRGLIEFGPRPDGRSGTAYRITDTGRETL